MACGIPVVASDRTSIPEILGDAPLYVDPSDPASISSGIQKVIGDSSLRDKLVRSGLERLRNFSPRATGEAMKAIVDKVLSGI